ncbi:MAG: hypothetical protein ACKVXR_18695 [Planctomycetota bacterium]
MSSAPGIPRRLARRLDRLARRAHAFHRFAHHPLCDEYEGELFRCGRQTRVCRGCALAGIGAIAGAGLALVLPPSLALAAAAVPLAAVSALASFRARSIGKLTGRFLPAGLLFFGIVSGLRSGQASGLVVALAALGAGALLVRVYRLRGPHRGPCQVCPEQGRASPCRGFAPIVRRERAFRRVAGLLLDSR